LNRFLALPTSMNAAPIGAVSVTLAVAVAFKTVPASVRRLLIDKTSADTNDRFDGPGTLSRSFTICSGELTSAAPVSTSWARCSA